MAEELANTAAAIEAWQWARAEMILSDPANVFANLALLLRTARTIMALVNRPHIELPDMSAFLRPATVTARITDLAAVPDDYVEMVRRPRLDAIATDLEAGVVIPGTQLMRRQTQIFMKEQS